MSQVTIKKEFSPVVITITLSSPNDVRAFKKLSNVKFSDAHRHILCGANENDYDIVNSILDVLHKELLYVGTNAGHKLYI